MKSQKNHTDQVLLDSSEKKLFISQTLPVFFLEAIGFCRRPGEDSFFMFAGDPAMCVKKKLKIYSFPIQKVTQEKKKEKIIPNHNMYFSIYFRIK